MSATEGPTIREAEDFRAESRAIAALLEGQPADCFAFETQFKGWTINDVIAHLHFWNAMAALQIEDEQELKRRLGLVMKMMAAGQPIRQAEDAIGGALSGPELLAAYSVGAEHVADLFAKTDPKARLQWAGPEMSARSSISARLMETWAHTQAIYDRLGIDRVEDDRIAAIAMLGVNTFGWTFRARGQEPPGPMPYVRLTAPSGTIWEYGEADAAESIKGSAVEFCQVVTQTRNIADTQLVVRGDVAAAWMANAQCFAGAANEPPAPGTRSRAK